MGGKGGKAQRARASIECYGRLVVRTVLPSLTPAAAFLAFEEGVAPVEAVAAEEGGPAGDGARFEFRGFGSGCWVLI